MYSFNVNAYENNKKTVLILFLTEKSNKHGSLMNYNWKYDFIH